MESIDKTRKLIKRIETCSSLYESYLKNKEIGYDPQDVLCDYNSLTPLTKLINVNENKIKNEKLLENVKKFAFEAIKSNETYNQIASYIQKRLEDLKFGKWSIKVNADDQKSEKDNSSFDFSIAGNLRIRLLDSIDKTTDKSSSLALLDIDKRKNFKNLTFAAVASGNLEQVKFFIEQRNVDVNSRGEFESSFFID